MIITLPNGNQEMDGGKQNESVISGTDVCSPMETWTVLGLLAGMLTTIGFVPQIVKGYRSKRMNDVSLTMPVLLSMGMALWFFYGVILGDIPIMLWNLIALGLNIAVIFLILIYRQKQSSA
jgi:MtN3 and saliva related transmembrane protein